MDAIERRHAIDAVSNRQELARYLASDSGILMAVELMDLPNRVITEEEYRNAEAIRMRLLRDTLEAEVCLATDDVCEALRASYEAYPTTEVFMSDVLMPTGMIYFTETLDNPNLVQDQRLRALLWSMLDMKDGTYVLTIIGFSDSRILDIPANRRNDLPSIYPFTSVLWKLEEKDGGIFHIEDWGEEATYHRRPYVKLLLSYWAIVRQRLAQAEETSVKMNARERKKSRTGKGPRTGTGLRIYRLRRRNVYTASENTSGTGTKLTKRVVVRPFWRNQWYAKTEEHKPKLILSHVRGPEGAPISGAERAYLPPKKIGE